MSCPRSAGSSSLKGVTLRYKGEEATKNRGRKADGLTTLRVGRIWKGAEVLAKMFVELYTEQPPLLNERDIDMPEMSNDFSDLQVGILQSAKRCNQSVRIFEILGGNRANLRCLRDKEAAEADESRRRDVHIHTREETGINRSRV
ncbi:hypothetical protein P692DRAFT_201808598 [Suillus brevipes Sb2]|nr:hypothetical protein P692DRAFT_201808598 [Suillus brevipes Sb2]